jgi:hypothetical protein
MLHLFSLTGTPTEKHCILMNGDLVDRGSWSVEVILTAFAYKCWFCSNTWHILLIIVQGCTLNHFSSTEVTTKRKI